MHVKRRREVGSIEEVEEGGLGRGVGELVFLGGRGVDKAISRMLEDK